MRGGESFDLKKMEIKAMIFGVFFFLFSFFFLLQHSWSKKLLGVATLRDRYVEAYGRGVTFSRNRELETGRLE